MNNNTEAHGMFVRSMRTASLARYNHSVSAVQTAHFYWIRFYCLFSDNNEYDDDNDGCILYWKWINGIGMRALRAFAHNNTTNWTIINRWISCEFMIMSEVCPFHRTRTQKIERNKNVAKFVSHRNNINKMLMADDAGLRFYSWLSRSQIEWMSESLLNRRSVWAQAPRTKWKKWTRKAKTASTIRFIEWKGIIKMPTITTGTT